MRTYTDIDTFSEWTSEEQYQFSLAVTKGLIMDMVRKANSCLLYTSDAADDMK